MGCRFVCQKNKGLSCCECAANGINEECTESKCDLNCLNEESEEERLAAQWYYENYVKPQEEQNILPEGGN